MPNIYTEHATEVNATEHASEARQCHKCEHNGSRWCKDPKAQLVWSKGIVAMSFACNRGDVMQSKSFGCNRARCHAMELPHASPRAASMGLQGKPVPIGILQSHLGIELSGGGKANPRSKWTVSVLIPHVTTNCTCCLASHARKGRAGEHCHASTMLFISHQKFQIEAIMDVYIFTKRETKEQKSSVHPCLQGDRMNWPVGRKGNWAQRCQIQAACRQGMHILLAQRKMRALFKNRGSPKAIYEAMPFKT